MRLFILLYFLIYGGMNLYVVLRTREGLGLGGRSTAALGAWAVLMVLAPIFVRLLEARGFEVSGRAMAWVGFVWFGFAFWFWAYGVGVDIARIIFSAANRFGGESIAAPHIPARLAFLIPLILTLFSYAVGAYQAWQIQLEHLPVESRKIDRPLRIVQISDVHLGLIVRDARLERILDQVRRAEPDMLVATGDLVDGQIDNLTSLAEMLREIEPPLGKYAITGNHEYYAGLGQALSFIRDAGFTVLRGEGVVIEKDGRALINLAGVDDPTAERYGGMKGKDETALLETLPGENFTLFLKHQPIIEKKSLGLFDLQLSGHSHKGQIFPFNLATMLRYNPHAGYKDKGKGSAIYVSRGSGTWGPPARLLSPPEVTLIELRPKRNI